jgi:hypothetical protein
MRLRVRQVERLGLGAMVPTRPSPDPQSPEVHRLAIEALGGIELEHPVGAQT